MPGCSVIRMCKLLLLHTHFITYQLYLPYWVFFLLLLLNANFNLNVPCKYLLVRDMKAINLLL